MRLNLILLLLLCHPIYALGTQIQDALRDRELVTGNRGKDYYLYRDVPYLGRNQKQRLDIYCPVYDDSEPVPAVLIIHGGGWATGNKGGGREKQFAEFMVELGYVAVSTEYTLTTYEGRPWSSPKIKGAWPQNIYDCKSALRFIRQYSDKLNVNPGKIAVMGGSAGGHLAMLVGFSSKRNELNKGGLYTNQSNEVNCIINLYGIPDVRKWGGGAFIDVPLSECPETWALASPIEHLTQDSPPILIIHGTDDKTVDISLSEELVRVLKQKNIQHQYIPVKNGTHSFALDVKEAEMDLRPAISNFLRQYLGQSKINRQAIIEEK